MKEIIASLANQVRAAIQIGESLQFKQTKQEIRSVVVCGLGGSGIGGKIISLLFNEELKVPFCTISDYQIPAFVDEHTLVIASSYSGKTEETIFAVKEGIKRGAEIVVITSGGELLEMAKTNGWNYALVPGGEQPRAMLAFSLIQQIYMLSRYGLISPNHLIQLTKIPDFIDLQSEQIKSEAKQIVDLISNKTVVIYAGSYFEGIAVRFRQQLNENAKELCWHHILPEMTHNELVGWAGGSDRYAVLFISSSFDHPRTTYRWEICNQVISKYTSSVSTIKAKGEDRLHHNFYLIHLTDWVSLYLAEKKGVNPEEVDVIGHLKSQMAKYN